MQMINKIVKMSLAPSVKNHSEQSKNLAIKSRLMS